MRFQGNLSERLYCSTQQICIYIDLFRVIFLVFIRRQFIQFLFAFFKAASSVAPQIPLCWDLHRTVAAFPWIVKASDRDAASQKLVYRIK